MQIGWQLRLMLLQHEGKNKVGWYSFHLPFLNFENVSCGLWYILYHSKLGDRDKLINSEDASSSAGVIGACASWGCGPLCTSWKACLNSEAPKLSKISKLKNRVFFRKQANWRQLLTPAVSTLTVLQLAECLCKFNIWCVDLACDLVLEMDFHTELSETHCMLAECEVQPKPTFCRGHIAHLSFSVY